MSIKPASSGVQFADYVKGGQRYQHVGGFYYGGLLKKHGVSYLDIFEAFALFRTSSEYALASSDRRPTGTVGSHQCENWPGYSCPWIRKSWNVSVLGLAFARLTRQRHTTLLDVRRDPSQTRPVVQGVGAPAPPRGGCSVRSVTDPNGVDPAALFVLLFIPPRREKMTAALIRAVDIVKRLVRHRRN